MKVKLSRCMSHREILAIEPTVSGGSYERVYDMLPTKKLNNVIWVEYTNSLISQSRPKNDLKVFDI